MKEDMKEDKTVRLAMEVELRNRLKKIAVAENRTMVAVLRAMIDEREKNLK